MPPGFGDRATAARAGWRRRRSRGSLRSPPRDRASRSSWPTVPTGSPPGSRPASVSMLVTSSSVETNGFSICPRPRIADQHHRSHGRDHSQPMARRTTSSPREDIAAWQTLASKDGCEGGGRYRQQRDRAGAADHLCGDSTHVHTTGSRSQHRRGLALAVQPRTARRRRTRRSGRPGLLDQKSTPQRAR